jgi:tetratricopeptide (TPR) repeat protein
MVFDPYAPCPCGSGKKFKWCCQPIHVQIGRAFEQDAEGQHEAALRIMEEVALQHPGNPEVWGRQAQLLYENDQVDAAEAALQKSLDINPNYPFGYLLRGIFRKTEGELAGALLLFRKAAELYDPEAKDPLANVYALIGECELHLRRPLAARAAFQTSSRLHPTEELNKALTELFGDKSALPAAVRRSYTLMPLPASATPGERTAWERALSTATTGKLTDAAKAFQQLATEMPQEPAVWYNMGLIRTWLGENAAAIEAFDRYVSLEADEEKAAAAWNIAEVLRFGQGMEDQSDYVERSVLFQIRDPQRFFDFLNLWQREGFLYGVRFDQQQGTIAGIALDRSGLITAGAGAPQFPKLGAYLLVIGDMLRISNVNSDALDRVRQDIQERAGPSLSEAQLKRGPANFNDVVAEALVFPIGTTDEALVREKIREQVQLYFEEKWIHRPLRSLNQIPPIDAAGHPVLRKKLRGVVKFLRETLENIVEAYDFDRLLRKLGITEAAQAVSPSVDGEKPLAIDGMGAAELAELEPKALSDEQLDQAYRAAQKLDAHELAGRFAKAIVARPPRADRPDRFPWYSYLVQRSLFEGDTDAAMQYVDEGEKADCEQNEGRRRNDYELRRGQVCSKRGDAEGARDVFERLIERSPSELRYRGTAAEAMLSMKQGASALHFAEGGLAKAREQNDRDSEQYFMELVAAARKQTG